MEEQKRKQNCCENGRKKGGPKDEEEGEEGEEGEILQFLDSMDSYLTLIDSLSSTLRQGWLELASARHSMGSSRITSALFDLKSHSASSKLQVTQLDDQIVEQSHFSLSKWSSPNDKKCCSEEVEIDEENLQKTSNGSQLRHRGSSHASGVKEEHPESDGSPLSVDNQVEMERSKSLLVFGTLVSPKLRGAQLSFEKALETLVQIANARSTMLSAHAQIKQRREDYH